MPGRKRGTRGFDTAGCRACIKRNLAAQFHPNALRAKVHALVRRVGNLFPSPVAVVRQVYALAGPDNPAAQDIIRSIQANSHASDGDFDAVLSAWQARETATQAAPGQGASDCGETG